MSLSDNIKHLRKLNKMSQRDLGVVSNVTHVSIGHYESGNREPDSVILSAMSQRFGVTMDMLVNGDMVAMFPDHETYDAWLSDAEDRQERQEAALELLRESPYRLEALIEHYSKLVEKLEGTPARKTLREIEKITKRLLEP